MTFTMDFSFGIMMVIYLMVFMAWVSIFYFRKQFLISLLSLEFTVLGLFLGVSMLLVFLGKPVSISFYLLAFGACETSLGLSLLVSMARYSGGDMLSVLSSSKC